MAKKKANPGPKKKRTATDAGQTAARRATAARTAEREGLTVRQLAGRFGGYAGMSFVGTPKQIADEMETWLMEGASDGFNIMFPYLPAGLDDFVDQRRVSSEELVVGFPGGVGGFAGSLGTRTGVESIEDMAHVHVDRSGAEVELRGNLFVCQAECQLAQYLALALR